MLVSCSVPMCRSNTKESAGAKIVFVQQCFSQFVELIIKHTATAVRPLVLMFRSNSKESANSITIATVVILNRLFVPPVEESTKIYANCNVLRKAY